MKLIDYGYNLELRAWAIGQQGTGQIVRRIIFSDAASFYKEYSKYFMQEVAVKRHCKVLQVLGCPLPNNRSKFFEEICQIIANDRDAH